MDLTLLPDLAAVAVMGILVGAGELISRYRDEPQRALASGAARLYVLVNAGASVGALGLAHAFGWTFGLEAGSAGARLTQILVAGFGAMAFFRTSFFVVRAGGTDIGVGPIAFLQIVLGAADRGVDRSRARNRAPRVSEIMRDLRYDEIRESLPVVAMSLLQNLSAEDQTDLGKQVRDLSTSTMPDRAKVLNLGLLLMNFVGEDVLEAAVKALRIELASEPSTPEPPTPEPSTPEPSTPEPSTPPEPEATLPAPPDPEPEPRPNRPRRT